MGTPLTETVLTAVLVQPNALAPVTVQLVMVVGLTTFDPDEQVQVFAPLGISVNELPLQIAPEFIVILGVPLTVTVLTAELVQPNALVPVTVQLVIVVGLTTFDPEE